MDNRILREFRISARYTVPVLAGYGFLGFAFGLLVRTQGYSPLLPVVMSLIVFSGALEFAAVPMLSAAFDPISAFVIGIMLSVRHLFYGIPMLKKYDGTGKSKLFLIFGLTDEAFSILSANEVPEGVRPKSFYLWVTFLNYFYWVSFTALGALLGSLISFDLEGLDFALTALFIVLFLDQLKDRQGRISGFAGLIACAIVLMLVGSKAFVLVSMAAILVILLGGRKVIGRE